MAKKVSWADSIPSSEEDTDVMDEPGVSSAEVKEVEKSDRAVHGNTSEPGTSSATEEYEEVEDSGTFYKPGISPHSIDYLEIQKFPVVNGETGEMYKVYEILMKKLGVEIPELRYENLSSFEKELRAKKKNSLIFFEEVDEEEEKIALARTLKGVLGVVHQICRRITHKRMFIRTAKMVPSHRSGTVITKVKFDSLEDKKMILANKEILIGTKYSVDHDLTRTEIHVQSQLLKLWRKKGYRKNFLLNKKARIQVDYKWITLHPVSSPSTTQSTK